MARRSANPARHPPLRAQGRLREALPPMRAALRMYEAMQDWTWAAVAASNLSQTELVVAGTVQKIDNLTTYADALSWNAIQ